MRASSLIPLLAAALLAGCVSVDYLGETHPPTDRVDFYYFDEDLPPGYSVIGTAEARAALGTAIQEIEDRLRQEAMAVGADGVLVHTMDTLITGESTSWHEYGDWDFRHGSASTSINRERQLHATFIRYRETDW